MLNPMLVLFLLQIFCSQRQSVFHLRFTSGGPILLKTFLSLSDEQEKNSRWILNADPEAKKFQKFRLHIHHFYEKISQVIDDYEKTFIFNKKTTEQVTEKPPKKRKTDNNPITPLCEYQNTDFLEATDFKYPNVKLLTVSRSANNLHVAFQIDQILIDFTTTSYHINSSNFVPEFKVLLPVKREIFDILTMLDISFDLIHIKNFMDLFTETYFLMRYLMKLKIFLDNYEFYIRFLAQTIIFNNLIVKDDDFYWLEFRSHKAVRECVYFMSESSYFELTIPHSIYPTFWSAVYKPNTCLKSFGLVQNEREITMVETHPYFIVGDYSDILKRRMVMVIYLNHEIFKKLKQSIYPQIKMIWLESKELMYYPDFNKTFPFLEVVLIRNEQVNQFDLVSNLEAKAFFNDTSLPVYNKKMTLKEIPAKINYLYDHLVFSGVKVTNQFLIDLRKIVKSGCVLEFKSCKFEYLDFSDSENEDILSQNPKQSKISNQENSTDVVENWLDNQSNVRIIQHDGKMCENNCRKTRETTQKQQVCRKTGSEMVENNSSENEAIKRKSNAIVATKSQEKNFSSTLKAKQTRKENFSWSKVVSTWSNTSIKLLYCENCSKTDDLRSVWARSIITKDIHLVENPKLGAEKAD